IQKKLEPHIAASAASRSSVFASVTTATVPAAVVLAQAELASAFVKQCCNKGGPGPHGVI
ncbi:MAG: hypothetical protein ACRDQF_17290, partial [Thermocrispum sp.]